MNIVNRKAFHEYTILKEFIAGLKLVGSEVKSIRENGANLQDSYCLSIENEMIIRGLYIPKNKMSSYTNHEEKRERVLLLNKREIKNIVNEVKNNNGLTIIPLEIFEYNGKFKVKIGIAKGKKLWDKRIDKKNKDVDRSARRELGVNIS